MSDKTIIDYFEANATKHADRRFFTQPMGGGDENLKFFTFKEVHTEAKKMAGYLESLKLEPKSQIAICSKNCAWWIIADLAIWMAGHISVPVYPTLTAETTKFILEHSESKLLFVGKLDAPSWTAMKGGIPAGLPTISFPLCPSGEGVAEKKWDDIMAKATPIKSPFKRSLGEMSTIIYTSGSTGVPKGVMTSFRAMTECTVGVCKVLAITEKDRYLSYLPVAHGMDRWLGECVPLYSGMALFFAESLKTFATDLQRCRPTLFLSVPRLWTKFQVAVNQKLPPKKLNMLLKIPIISMLVKKKVVKTLGLDACRFAGSGSAPLPQELLEWYRKMGLELLEGYGMTENFNYSHLSMPGKVRVGYVGNAYQECECRIAEDGEIQVKTPGKMMGYFKNEEATRDALTEDGWVRTGDKGSLDQEKRLKITGRTKEIFKTSKGKYVAPAPIENLFIPHPHVELACVSGKGQPQPYIVIQLSENIKLDAAKGAKEREEIGKELENHMVKVVNPTLDPHEQLQFLVIVKDDWIPENGFLTPTQKIRRNVIEDTYGPNDAAWYGKREKVIWHGW